MIHVLVDGKSWLFMAEAWWLVVAARVLLMAISLWLSSNTLTADRFMLNEFDRVTCND